MVVVLVSRTMTICLYFCFCWLVLSYFMLTPYLLRNVQQRTREFPPRPKYFLLLTMKIMGWGTELQFEHERDRHTFFWHDAKLRHKVSCLVKYQITKTVDVIPVRNRICEVWYLEQQGQCMYAHIKICMMYHPVHSVYVFQHLLHLFLCIWVCPVHPSQQSSHHSWIHFTLQAYHLHNSNSTTNRSLKAKTETLISINCFCVHTQAYQTWEYDNLVMTGCMLDDSAGWQVMSLPGILNISHPRTKSSSLPF